ncbi:MAG TPA: hypothetical protein VMX55_00370 [candidate division Zixibacteria bacterium]|nr:hypothetical protein [candidate division Zixibacteria bacterium]
MSNLNIQWKLGKPFGILAILASFAIISQIPIIYHAREILGVINVIYLPAYIAITIASVFILATAEMILYESLLVRLRSYDVKDYRAPFLASSIILAVYYICYYLTYTILDSVELFGIQDPVAQYALCQMIGLVLIMIATFWYNKRQSKVFGVQS